MDANATSWPASPSASTSPPEDNDTLLLPPLGPVRDPLYVVIPITIVYSVILISGVLGNIVTCLVIARNRHMHTATNYYLFSLAVSDLLLLLSGLPQEMYFVWSRYPYVFGDTFCVLRGLAAEMSANATVLTITAFTVERYVAICHPFLSHSLSKLSRAIKIVVAIWLVALACAVPPALQFGVIELNASPEHVFCVAKRVIIEHSFEISTFLFFVTPMTLITVLYVLIGVRLHSSDTIKSFSKVKLKSRTDWRNTTTRKGSAPAALQASVSERGNSARHYASPASRRVLKMLVAVVVAFFICWAPFHAQRLVAIYVTDPEEPQSPLVYAIVTYASGVLYYLSTSINPLLYHLMSHKFRAAFKETLAGCCCCFRRRPSDSRSSRLRDATAVKTTMLVVNGGGASDLDSWRRATVVVAGRSEYRSLSTTDNCSKQDELTAYMLELQARPGYKDLM